MSRKSAVPPPVTAVIDTAGAWLPARLGEVERLLAEVSQAHGPKLTDDALGTLRAGGKRLRPLLVLLCGGEESGAAAVRSAAAVELIHMATLVHDDVLDAAPLRRGVPTVVASAGREAATGVGDLLLSRAFAVLAEAGDTDAVQLLSAASVALARGELAQRADAFDVNVTEERYLERCRLKTARLFESACLLGLVAAGADRDGEQARQLRAFGADIGLAFQLLDDVLDVSGPPERTGKARGTDLLDGTVTLPLIRAREIVGAPGSSTARRVTSGAEPHPPDRAAARLLARLDLRELDPESAEHACNAIAATGALAEVRERGLELVAEAKRRLAAAGFEPSRRRLLDMIADGVVERYS